MIFSQTFDDTGSVLCSLDLKLEAEINPPFNLEIYAKVKYF